MATVLHWVDRHDGAQPLSVLSARAGEAAPATDVLAGILATDSREQSGIWSTTSGILRAYRSTGALASTEPPYFDAAAFCDGANTLYLCSSGRQQQLWAPLMVGLLAEVRDAAYQRHRRGGGGPPVLLALDEAANIAPIPDLPAMVSEGAGQGLLTVASLQDLSQARRRWGREGDAFLSLFGTTVVLPGIADVPTLQAVSTLAGEEEVPTRSVGTGLGHDGRRRPSASWSTVHRPRLPVDVVGRGHPGMALALDAANRIGWVRLTPAHAHDPWRELVVAGRARTGPVPRRDAPSRWPQHSVER
jgi:type IV secretory pathway TraG/TraD family ATPase VirD4